MRILLECGGWTPLWMCACFLRTKNPSIQSGVQPPHSKSLLAAKRHWPQMFRYRSKHRRRQKQQGPYQKNGAKENESEGHGVRAQRPDCIGRRLLGRQAAGERNRGDDRNETTEQHHKAARNVPLYAVRRGWGRVVLRFVKAIRVPEPREAGAIVGRGRGELVE